MKHLKNLLLVSSLLSTIACSETLTRLDELGSGPQLSKVASPADSSGYKPISNWPTQTESVPPRNSNSLWQQGSRSFFKDQRANRVGDILTVVVQISDKAALNNTTTATRANKENIGASKFFGFETKIGNILPGGNTDPSNLASIDSSKNTTGGGTIGRQEDITTRVSAIITQILPNGNLAIKGTQQVRINDEMREVGVEGVIRPEDISYDNTIQSEQIAEARISYGGRGTISYANQPRYGSDLIDIVSPF